LDDRSGGAFTEYEPVIEPQPPKPASWRKQRNAPQSPRSRQKSALSNGRLTLQGDQRSAWARRAKDLLADFCADAGPDASAATLALCMRCSVICVELERRESEFIQAGQISDQQLLVYGTMTNTLSRTLKMIGLKRRAKVVRPLADIIKEIEAEEADGDSHE
jgi:hypothetical protein